MQAAKETASNIAASAQSGMDKTKATLQEKVEKVKAHDPMEKQMATQRKEEKINQAELNKQEIRNHNAAARHVGGATGGTTGLSQTSSLPGHGTGQPTGQVAGGTVGRTLSQNPRAGGETNRGYGTGGSYS